MGQLVLLDVLGLLGEREGVSVFEMGCGGGLNLFVQEFDQHQMYFLIPL